jgi:hypothetical protein
MDIAVHHRVTGEAADDVYRIVAAVPVPQTVMLVCGRQTCL